MSSYVGTLSRLGVFCQAKDTFLELKKRGRTNAMIDIVHANVVGCNTSSVIDPQPLKGQLKRTRRARPDDDDFLASMVRGSFVLRRMQDLPFEAFLKSTSFFIQW